ncbi:hypothetical protein [Acanthamoeba polyphaga mimivirus]|uniref:Uncharacterized protein n=1 Tax=Acanthamoeba polyphaga mimivirus TaxID=212035 RepID=A0A0G2Y0P0_MIMIV|nr:hypothetical protein [Acanthamoeba polyphaga mimivirus]
MHNHNNSIFRGLINNGFDKCYTEIIIDSDLDNLESIVIDDIEFDVSVKYLESETIIMGKQKQSYLGLIFWCLPTLKFIILTNKKLKTD